MKIYTIPMVPGPTSVPERVLRAGMINYGSGDLEEEFIGHYSSLEKKLQQLFGTKNQVVVQTGEGMLALWSALKSTLKAGDKVLAVSSGIFGTGIGEMARSIGCEVKTIAHPYNGPAIDFETIEKAIVDFGPKMITAVHCETPSGVMNPLEKLGALKAKYNVPLLYVDAVASVGAEVVDVDKHHIDLCLGGSQKVLSAPANSAFLTVSEKAWAIAEEIGYVGYDALLPFRDAVKNRYFPYTPSWVNIEQLSEAANIILDEGLAETIKRHHYNACQVREAMRDMGYKAYVEDEKYAACTVSAYYVPEGIVWNDFDRSLRAKGLAVGGSYGELSGKIFRLGHMGSQSDANLLDQALEVLKGVNH